MKATVSIPELLRQRKEQAALEAQKKAIANEQ